MVIFKVLKPNDKPPSPSMDSEDEATTDWYTDDADGDEDETDDPEKELKPGVDILGDVDEIFYETYDRFVTFHDFAADNYFITKEAVVAALDVLALLMDGNVNVLRPPILNPKRIGMDNVERIDEELLCRLLWEEEEWNW
ncbi:Guanosine nucleotide diphosphate dissociation inhibitor [Capsicum chinense]|nr:Guanosine nucleotide diphosphate dissociation inhibitor [Capsicum chinense]